MRFPNPLQFLHALILFCRRPKLVPAAVRLARHERCSGCEYSENEQCQVCSCYIPLKVMLATEKCPLKRPRWTQYFRFHSGLPKL